MKYVIYTVLTGGYDQILQPLAIDDRFDYILFTDTCSSERIGVWQVRKIPFGICDMSKMSRYPKMHPESLLKEYDVSLYIDGNVQITSSYVYDRIIELSNQNIDWAGIKHPLRDCIYDEAFLVLANSLESDQKVYSWCHRLLKEKYPFHYGMFENNIIYRKHSEKTQLIDKDWWFHYIHNSRRDQLILMYIMWIHKNLNICYILPPGEDSRNSLSFSVKNHRKSLSCRTIGIKGMQYYINRIRSAFCEDDNHVKRIHYYMWRKNEIMFHLLMQIWYVYALFFLSGIALYRIHRTNKLC